MACSGGKDDDTDDSVTVDADADTDTDTDTDTSCGDSLPTIVSADSSAITTGDPGVEVQFLLEDPDGDLHRLEVQAWFDTLVDGIVDTSSGADLSTGFVDFTGPPNNFVPCDVTALTLSVPIPNSVGFTGGVTHEIAYVVLDADGNVSNGFVTTVCPPLDDGTVVTCTGPDTGATGDTGAETGGTGDTGTTTGDTSSTGDTGLTTVGYAADIEPIVYTECQGCHDGSGSFDASYTDMLALSDDIPTMPRITPFDPANSYVWLKLNNLHIAAGGAGDPMPESGPLPQPALDLFEAWINDGALP